LQIAYGPHLPADEQRRILRGVLRLLGEAVVETVICSEQDMLHNIALEGFEHLEHAAAAGSGAIILGPHLGVWELAGYALGARLHNAATVFKPLKNPYVNNYLIAARERIVHLDLIPSKKALRPVLSRLRKGGAVVILFDQNAGHDGVPATFFGGTASTYAAPASFAIKTGCAVIPAYTVKEPGFRRHRIVVSKPFPLISTGTAERDLLANTQQYNDFFEAVVRQYPDQWFGWLHKRWKLPRAWA
jgi:KDO2-lipid IV(A) lauroyltransferase